MQIMRFTDLLDSKYNLDREPQKLAQLTAKVLQLGPDIENVEEEQRLSWALGLSYPESLPLSVELNPMLVYAALGQIFMTYKPAHAVVDAVMEPLAKWADDNKERMREDNEWLWDERASQSEWAIQRQLKVAEYISEWCQLYPGVTPPRSVRIIHPNETKLLGSTALAACNNALSRDDKLTQDIICAPELFEALGNVTLNRDHKRKGWPMQRRNGVISAYTQCMQVLFHEFLHVVGLQTVFGKCSQIADGTKLARGKLQREAAWQFVDYTGGRRSSYYSRTIDQLAHLVAPTELFVMAFQAHPRYPYAGSPSQDDETEAIYI